MPGRSAQELAVNEVIMNDIELLDVVDDVLRGFLSKILRESICTKGDAESAIYLSGKFFGCNVRSEVLKSVVTHWSVEMMRLEGGEC